MSVDFSNLTVVDETQTFKPFASFLPTENNNNNEKDAVNNLDLIEETIDNNNNNNSNNNNVFGMPRSYNNNEIEIENENDENEEQIIDPKHITSNTIEEVSLTITNDKSGKKLNEEDKNGTTKGINLYDNTNYVNKMDTNNNDEHHIKNNVSVLTANENVLIEARMDEYRNEIQSWRDAYVSLLESKLELIDATAKEQEKLRNIIQRMAQNQNR